MTETVRGTDHYKGDWIDGNTGRYVGIDFPTARRNGSRFSFLKAFDGLQFVETYPDAKAEADAAGHCNAPYCWLYSHAWVSINGQGDAWYGKLKDAKIIAVDFEDYLGQDFPTGSDLWGALTRLKANGYKGLIVLYTRWGYWVEFCTDNPAWLDLIDFIWLADPDGNDSLPKIPAPFTEKHLLFKQDSWEGDPATYGIRNNKKAVDLDLFYGSEEELIEFFGGGVYNPPEPPIGETMSISIGTVLARGLNVRSTPNSSSPANIIGVEFLRSGDLVQYDKVQGFWGRLTAARRGGVDLVLPGVERWSFLGETNGYIRPEWKIDAAPEENPDAMVSVDLGGANVDGKDYAPDHLEGSKVVFKKVE